MKGCRFDPLMFAALASRGLSAFLGQEGGWLFSTR